MLYPIETVPLQFKQATNLLGIMDTHAEQYNQIEATLESFTQAYALASAIGQQLDAIGHIIGLPRPLTEDEDKYFVFENGIGKGFGNRFGTADGGEFIGYSEDGIALASDSEYRDLLYITLYANLSRSTGDDIIRIINNLSGTKSKIIEGYEETTHKIAKFTIQVIGAENLKYKNFLERYMSKPLGVEMVIEPYPITGSLSQVVKYIGNDTAQSITTTENVDIGLAFFKNLSIASEFILASTTAGERNAVSFSSASSGFDYGVQIFHDKEVIISGANPFLNKNGNNFIMWAVHFTSKGVTQSSDNISSEWALNSLTGVGTVEWTGSGSDEQHVQIPFTKPPSIMFCKDLTVGGDVMVVGAEIEGDYLTLNTDNPLREDDVKDIRLLGKGIGTKGEFNKAGHKYTGFIFSKSYSYSEIHNYTSKGIVDTKITLTFEPNIVIIKRLDHIGDWVFYTKEVMGLSNPYEIYMNGQALYQDANRIAFLTDGFRLLDTNPLTNELGGLYMYIAFKA